MKRSLLVLSAVAVVLTPLAATAAPAKAKPRTITFDYTGFATAGTDGASLSYDGPCVAVPSCWDFSTAKGEKVVEIKDDAGAGFQVWLNDDYEGTVASFCGSGKVVVSPKAATTVSVRPFLSDCGVPTQGTYTAVISKAK